MTRGERKLERQQAALSKLVETLAAQLAEGMGATVSQIREYNSLNRSLGQEWHHIPVGLGRS